MQNSNVNIIDPNQVISNLPSYLNGAPPYEQMYIFVELTARRKGRTVLETTNNGVGANKIITGFEDDVSISMMGYDQSTNNTEHTSKYIFNTAIGGDEYEGFGIENIKIQTNSSFIPKVTIDFIDIRGNSFAQGRDSIYNILFDFPPPIYKLTVKGYYGRALTYELHLLKYNVKFASDTGNYHISAEFVARTFAPLTDVLFKYVETFPLIDLQTGENPLDESFRVDDPTTVNINEKIAPRSTYELIKKLESLYDQIVEVKDTSQEAKQLTRATKTKNEIKEFFVKLNNFKNEYANAIDDEIKESGVFIVENVIREEQEPNMETYDDTKRYNTFLASKGSETIQQEIEKRLLIGFPIGDIQTNETGNTVFIEDTNISNKVSRNLRLLRESLLRDAGDIETKYTYTNDNDFIKPTYDPNTSRPYATGTTITDDITNIQYRYIDITSFYEDLYLYQVQSLNTVSEKQKQVVGKINEVVFQQLGMRPTIYNIFKIICDDIDRFFDRLKSTSVEAERHHALNENKIVQNSNVKDNTVTAFPLFVSGETVCNVKRQARRMPNAENLGYDVSDFNGGEFPEALLVDKFMDTFVKIEKDERVAELKSQQDENNNSVWIPVNPADSALFQPAFDESPYYSLFNTTAKSADRIYEIFLNRFYIQSQHTYGLDFFEANKNNLVFKNKEKLIALIAKSEAVNIANSVTEDAVINKLLQDINNFTSAGPNILSAFTTTLQTRGISNYASVTNSDGNEDYLVLTNNTRLYRDRANSNYLGIELLYERDDEKLVDAKSIRSGQNPNNDDKVVNPIDNFLFSSESNWRTKANEYLKGIFDRQIRTGTEDQLSQFNINNIPYFPDVNEGDNKQSLYLLKRFSDLITGNVYSKDIVPIFTDETKTSDEIIQEAGIATELGLKDKNLITRDQKNTLFNTFAKFVDAWSLTLSAQGDNILEFLNGGATEDDFKLQAFILASNWLNTSGFFIDFYDVNTLLKYPALLEMPYYAQVYMGGLVEISRNSTLKDKLIEFLNTSLGRALLRVNQVLFFDLYKIELLAEEDKNKFHDAFLYFYSESQSGDFQDVVASTKVMIQEVDEEFKDKEISFWEEILEGDRRTQITDRFEDLLKSRYKNITNIMARKVVLLNFSQFTFNDPDNAVPTTYQPLSELIQDTNKINALNLYFVTFFNKLKETLDQTKRELNELEARFKSAVDDNDIRTQTYYSFKNLNDKWVAGENNLDIKGFPFNFDGKPLISKFAFVDRAMNPIGDEVIINAEPLIDMVKDYDISVFTVLSRLLSHNGFEFFPLQNFMAYEESEWEDSFRILEAVENQTAVPSFVCMYIGGTSSFLNNLSSQYDDDSLDLNDLTDVDDFGNEPCPNQPEVEDKPLINNNVEYPYGQVRAFRVRYAEQNQSIFKNIDIDSREYPDTNESLAILSKIAQDQSASSPVPKAQNLYNVFETRAYSANIEMFGNAMIQPTQYFQLENIPIFSGAYVILDVQHNIVPNKMDTKFTGVKVLKFPNPFVKEFATVVGLNAGDSTDRSGDDALDRPSTEDVYGSGGAATLPTTAQYNSMYTLNLKSNLDNIIGE